MQPVLDADAPQEIVEAIRLAAERSGLDTGRRRPTDRGAWWRQGVAEAVDPTTRVAMHHTGSAPAADREQAAYDVARSPRSTRGATRA
jgi:hypothetical protein